MTSPLFAANRRPLPPVSYFGAHGETPLATLVLLDSLDEFAGLVLELFQNHTHGVAALPALGITGDPPVAPAPAPLPSHTSAHTTRYAAAPKPATPREATKR